MENKEQNRFMHKLGSFYGKDIVLLDDRNDLPEQFFQKRWDDYLYEMKKEAVDAYKSEFFLQELEAHNPSLWSLIVKYYKK